MPERTRSEAEWRLLDDILTGALAPGTRLKIRDMASRYNVGPTPLREALSRLVPEGLVKFELNKGFRVSSLSLRELVEITEMRQTLEAEAFRRSVERGDDTWESEVVASFHRLNKSISSYVESDFAADTRLKFENHHLVFHKVLSSACDNRRMLRSVQVLHRHLIRYRAIFRSTEISGEELRGIHEDLLRIAVERDVEAAHFVMRRHVRINVEQVKEGLVANPALRTIIVDDL